MATAEKTLRIEKYVGSGMLPTVDAERIGGYLTREFGTHYVTARQVVDAARPQTSPIHRDFEWNDKTAAELYRAEQARFILRHLHVVFNGRPPTRAYHHVYVTNQDAEGKTWQESVYAPARVVWEDDALAQQVVERALRELRGWSARYSEYGELSTIAAKIDQLVLEAT